MDIDKRRVHKLHKELTATAPIKRSHVYELLAAAMGFHSYAALLLAPTPRAPDGVLLQRRLLQLKYPPEFANLVWSALRT